ncbi:ABC transporter ATP-binding protein [Candidatus Gracilibacteria bacterium]|nr:ABC transporter ATP-binding protein [Candidatus Gracilibacteria bacterium]OIO77613.1 MAG: macrolide ABC transporter ATP-binding protein [Candidatus Gracilibacteria bacterium CG1_02_38_174]PIQ12197.1 MAG: macrolide ABC transporter ATP-binding protein [Candidatus Gracilibacteria bacterium CG18_big_fil_WC_8_21_14_2_50_38_16]PIQ41580.1 MAG: macrolide ABC transporter ATP-binding protein [Candidatus Gracilibacteria bacterium CG12_big_fil_rev_8_21_14_0_65_38_15]PIZ02091.1 MAG: macrolide ABC transpo
MSPLIQMTQIVKTYQLGKEESIDVLKGVDIEINKGEFVSIMGQSGSGKSTLMNIIGMLDNPSKGKYFFDGADISDLTDDDQALIRRENIGFIFQSYNLLPRTSALNQVIMPLLYQNIGKKEREERSIKALEKVGLADKMNNLPNEMSGGQQQRVSIARALVMNPSIILADEPTGALDSKTGVEIMELLTELNKEGKTIIVITHEHEVDAYAARHILIKDGNIVN